jgi:hypothetical protein
MPTPEQLHDKIEFLNHVKKKSSTGNGVKNNEDLLAATPPE